MIAQSWLLAGVARRVAGSAFVIVVVVAQLGWHGGRTSLPPRGMMFTGPFVLHPGYEGSKSSQGNRVYHVTGTVRVEPRTAGDLHDSAQHVSFELEDVDYHCDHGP